MVSNFIRRIEEARKKGEAKLKVIAPKFTPPPSKIPKSLTVPKVSSRRGTSSSARVQAETKARLAREAAERAAKEAAEKAAREKLIIEQEAKRKLREAKQFRESKQVGEKRAELARQRVLQKEAKRKITVGEVQPAARATFIQRQERERERLRTKKQRGLKLTLKEEAILAGRTFVQSVSEFGVGVVALPSTLISVAKNPKQLKKVPSAIAEGGLEFGRLLRVSPTEAFAKIGTEIFLLKGTGKTLKVTGKVGGNAANKLDPFLKKVKGGKVDIKTTKGKTTLKVGVIGKGVPLRKQVKLSGKKLEVATSVQAKKIINRFGKGREKTIRKPIPGEESLTLRTKTLLERFDKGNINRKDFFNLNRRLIKETGDKTLLERSLFADPKGKIRFTRLGAEPPEAGIIDILSGDFTFRTPKPQILVFTDTPVARFPKMLKPVAKKLKAGKSLTESERIRLVEWQLKKSGKFKPLGDIKYRGGKELEVTIAPGELIKRKKKLGTTVIDGKRVQIVEAEIFKPSPSLKKVINKANKGLLNKKQTKVLEKKLEKLTGIKSKSIRRTRRVKPRARIPKRIPKIKRKKRKLTPTQRRVMLRNLARARSIRTGRISRPPKRPPKKPPARPPTRPPKRPPKKPPARPPKRPPKRPPTKPPVSPPRPKKIIRKKKLKKPVQVFDVFGKSGKRFVKLNTKPLARKDALDKGAFAVDRTTSRTFKIAPKGKSKTPGRLLKNEKNYFNRQGFKLREVRIKRGRKFVLKQKYIERTKHAIDTKSEKAGLTIAKLMKQQRRPSPAKARKILRDKKIRGRPLTPKQRKFFGSRANIKRPKKRKLTPTQRKVMLKNLEKARKVRKKKLKGGKK